MAGSTTRLQIGPESWSQRKAKNSPTSGRASSKPYSRHQTGQPWRNTCIYCPRLLESCAWNMRRKVWTKVICRGVSDRAHAPSYQVLEVVRCSRKNGKMEWRRCVPGFSAGLVCLAQWIVLAQFPINYESNCYFWLLELGWVAVAIGLLVWYRKGHEASYLWIVWLVYTLCLVITNAIVLAFVENKLNTEQKWGPHVLEITLSLASLLPFLLFAAANGSQLYILISFRLSLDLFDVVDMLGAVLEKEKLEEGQFRHAIPLEARIPVYIFVIVALLMSTFDLWGQVKWVESSSYPPCRTCIRTVGHIVINLVFLIMRGIFWGKYHHPAPLFMAKSGIYTVVHIIELVKSDCWMARRTRLTGKEVETINN